MVMLAFRTWTQRRSATVACRRRWTRPEVGACPSVGPASFATVLMNCGQSASMDAVLQAVIRWRALRGLRNKSNWAPVVWGVSDVALGVKRRHCDNCSSIVIRHRRRSSQILLHDQAYKTKRSSLHHVMSASINRRRNKYVHGQNYLGQCSHAYYRYVNVNMFNLIAKLMLEHM